MLPVIALTAGFIIICWSLALRVDPGSRLFKAFEKLCVAFMMLAAWNHITEPWELYLAINPGTLCATGILGLPGLAALAAIKALL